MRKIIKNAFIVSDKYDINKKLDMYISNGTIVKIGENIETNEETEIIDAEGFFVMPGFIDMYCKMCEAGYENKHNIVMISQSAAVGGFTTITSLPNSQPVIDNKTVVEYVYSKTREKSSINMFPYGSMTKECLGKEVTEIGEMIDAGIVAISDGGVPVDDNRLLRNILLYSKMFDVPVITFCLDRQLTGRGVINSGYMSTKMGLEGILREAEDVAVSRNIILAKNTGARLHISHVTTRGAVELVRYGKENGVNVTAGTCPHYFTLSEMAVEGYNTFAKVLPPLRTDDDIKAVKEGIKDGTIDVITSGHTPVSIDKKKTEFDNANFGISGLESAFPVCFTEMVDSGTIDIKDMVRLMSSNPAKILGLKNKGYIEEGFDADFIIVDLNEKYNIDASSFKSKAKYSPFDGKCVKGRAIKTFVKGNCIYEYYAKG